MIEIIWWVLVILGGMYVGLGIFFMVAPMIYGVFKGLIMLIQWICHKYIKGDWDTRESRKRRTI